MRQTREQKRQEKLQSLAVMMGLVDRFGTGRQTDDRLKQEQLLSAQQDRQRQQALLPLLLEQQQLANQGASADMAFAGERRPLELDQQRALLADMGLMQDYNRQTMGDRVGLVSSQAEAARRANDFERATYNDRLQVSGQAPALSAMQLKQSAQALTSQQLQDKANQQRMRQEDELFPLRQEEVRAATDYRRSMADANVATAEAARKAAGGQAQAAMSNVDPGVMEFDKLLGAGVRVPQQTLEQQTYYRQTLPKLIDSINQNPGAGWSPESRAIKQFFDGSNGQFDPASGITPEELDAILGPLQNGRKPLPTKKSVDTSGIAGKVVKAGMGGLTGFGF